MFRILQYQAVFTLALLFSPLVYAGGISSGTNPSIQSETWGGEHIKLMITGTSAEIQMDCASGQVDSGWVVKNNKVNAKGTMVTYQGIGLLPEQEARFRAIIKNEKMALRITTSNNTETFALTKDSEGVVYPCLRP